VGNTLEILVFEETLGKSRLGLEILKNMLQILYLVEIVENMSKLLFFYKFRTWNRISIFGLQFEEIM
jgi:hypothetical protein